MRNIQRAYPTYNKSKYINPGYVSGADIVDESRVAFDYAGQPQQYRYTEDDDEDDEDDDNEYDDDDEDDGGDGGGRGGGGNNRGKVTSSVVDATAITEQVTIMAGAVSELVDTLKNSADLNLLRTYNGINGNGNNNGGGGGGAVSKLGAAYDPSGTRLYAINGRSLTNNPDVLTPPGGWLGIPIEFDSKYRDRSIRDKGRYMSEFKFNFVSKKSTTVSVSESNGAIELDSSNFSQVAEISILGCTIPNPYRFLSNVGSNPIIYLRINNLPDRQIATSSNNTIYQHFRMSIVRLSDRVNSGLPIETDAIVTLVPENTIRFDALTAIPSELSFSFYMNDATLIEFPTDIYPCNMFMGPLYRTSVKAADGEPLPSNINVGDNIELVINVQDYLRHYISNYIDSNSSVDRYNTMLKDTLVEDLGKNTESYTSSITTIDDGEGVDGGGGGVNNKKKKYYFKVPENLTSGTTMFTNYMNHLGTEGFMYTLDKLSFKHIHKLSLLDADNLIRESINSIYNYQENKKGSFTAIGKSSDGLSLYLNILQADAAKKQGLSDPEYTKSGYGQYRIYPTDDFLNASIAKLSTFQDDLNMYKIERDQSSLSLDESIRKKGTYTTSIKEDLKTLDDLTKQKASMQTAYKENMVINIDSKGDVPENFLFYKTYDTTHLYNIVEATSKIPEYGVDYSNSNYTALYRAIKRANNAKPLSLYTGASYLFDVSQTIHFGRGAFMIQMYPTDIPALNIFDRIPILSVNIPYVDESNQILDFMVDEDMFIIIKDYVTQGYTPYLISGDKEPSTSLRWPVATKLELLESINIISSRILSNENPVDSIDSLKNYETYIMEINNNTSNVESQQRIVVDLERQIAEQASIVESINSYNNTGSGGSGSGGASSVAFGDASANKIAKRTALTELSVYKQTNFDITDKINALDYSITDIAASKASLTGDLNRLVCTAVAYSGYVNSETKIILTVGITNGSVWINDMLPAAIRIVLTHIPGYTITLPTYTSLTLTYHNADPNDDTVILPDTVIVLGTGFEQQFTTVATPSRWLQSAVLTADTDIAIAGTIAIPLVVMREPVVDGGGNTTTSHESNTASATSIIGTNTATSNSNAASDSVATSDSTTATTATSSTTAATQAIATSLSANTANATATTTATADSNSDTLATVVATASSDATASATATANAISDAVATSSSDSTAVITIVNNLTPTTIPQSLLDSIALVQSKIADIDLKITALISSGVDSLKTTSVKSIRAVFDIEDFDGTSLIATLAAEVSVLYKVVSSSASACTSRLYWYDDPFCSDDTSLIRDLSLDGGSTFVTDLVATPYVDVTSDLDIQFKLNNDTTNTVHHITVKLLDATNNLSLLNYTKQAIYIRSKYMWLVQCLAEMSPSNQRQTVAEYLAVQKRTTNENLVKHPLTDPTIEIDQDYWLMRMESSSGSDTATTITLKKGLYTWEEMETALGSACTDRVYSSDGLTVTANTAVDKTWITEVKVPVWSIDRSVHDYMYMKEGYTNEAVQSSCGNNLMWVGCTGAGTSSDGTSLTQNFSCEGSGFVFNPRGAYHYDGTIIPVVPSNAVLNTFNNTIVTKSCSYKSVVVGDWCVTVWLKRDNDDGDNDKTQRYEIMSFNLVTGLIGDSFSMNPPAGPITGEEQFGRALGVDSAIKSDMYLINLDSSSSSSASSSFIPMMFYASNRNMAPKYVVVNPVNGSIRFGNTKINSISSGLISDTTSLGTTLVGIERAFTAEAMLALDPSIIGSEPVFKHTDYVYNYAGRNGVVNLTEYYAAGGSIFTGELIANSSSSSLIELVPGGAFSGTVESSAISLEEGAVADATTVSSRPLWQALINPIKHAYTFTATTLNLTLNDVDLRTMVGGGEERIVSTESTSYPTVSNFAPLIKYLSLRDRRRGITSRRVEDLEPSFVIKSVVSSIRLNKKSQGTVWLINADLVIRTDIPDDVTTAYYQDAKDYKGSVPCLICMKLTDDAMIDEAFYIPNAYATPGADCLTNNNNVKSAEGEDETAGEEDKFSFVYTKSNGGDVRNSFNFGVDDSYMTNDEGLITSASTGSNTVSPTLTLRGNGLSSIITADVINPIYYSLPSVMTVNSSSFERLNDVAVEEFATINSTLSSASDTPVIHCAMNEDGLVVVTETRYGGLIDVSSTYDTTSSFKRYLPVNHKSSSRIILSSVIKFYERKETGDDNDVYKLLESYDLLNNTNASLLGTMDRLSTWNNCSHDYSIYDNITDYTQKSTVRYENSSSATPIDNTRLCLTVGTGVALIGNPLISNKLRIRKVGSGDGSTVKIWTDSIADQLSSPVIPGDSIYTSYMWPKDQPSMIEMKKEGRSHSSSLTTTSSQMKKYPYNHMDTSLTFKTYSKPVAWTDESKKAIDSIYGTSYTPNTLQIDTLIQQLIQLDNKSSMFSKNLNDLAVCKYNYTDTVVPSFDFAIQHTNNQDIHIDHSIDQTVTVEQDIVHDITHNVDVTNNHTLEQVITHNTTNNITNENAINNDISIDIDNTINIDHAVTNNITNNIEINNTDTTNMQNVFGITNNNNITNNIVLDNTALMGTELDKLAFKISESIKQRQLYDSKISSLSLYRNKLVQSNSTNSQLIGGVESDLPSFQSDATDAASILTALRTRAGYESATLNTRKSELMGSFATFNGYLLRLTALSMNPEVVEASKVLLTSNDELNSVGEMFDSTLKKLSSMQGYLSTSVKSITDATVRFTNMNTIIATTSSQLLNIKLYAYIHSLVLKSSTNVIPTNDIDPMFIDSSTINLISNSWVVNMMIPNVDLYLNDNQVKFLILMKSCSTKKFEATQYLS